MVKHLMRAAAVIMLWLAGSTTASGVSIGLQDTFEDGTSQN